MRVVAKALLVSRRGVGVKEHCQKSSSSSCSPSLLLHGSCWSSHGELDAMHRVAGRHPDAGRAHMARAGKLKRASHVDEAKDRRRRWRQQEIGMRPRDVSNKSDIFGSRLLSFGTTASRKASVFKRARLAIFSAATSTKQQPARRIRLHNLHRPPRDRDSKCGGEGGSIEVKSSTGLRTYICPQ